MSMFVSSFLPNGNYLIAADTRISKVYNDKPPVWVGDDCHKIIELNDKTFMFMSGALNLCDCVANNLKASLHGNSVKNSLMSISRTLVSMCDKKQVEKTFEEHGEVMAFLLVEATGHSIRTGLYLSSRNFEPLEYELNLGGVIVLGAYIPGCEDGIRGIIQSAKTYQEVVRAYRTAFNSQSREEVGGTLEMYEISPEHGLVNTMSYEIMDSPRMSKIVSEALCGMDMRLHWGKNQFPGGSQFSLNESGPWHDDCTDADEYKRDKQYDNTWGKPYKFRGKDGKDGRPGADGSDASVTFNNVLKALQKAASIQTTFITADEVGSPNIYGGKIYGAEMYANEFNVYPLDETEYTGAFNIHGIYNRAPYHFLRIAYDDSGLGTPEINFGSPDGASAVWTFGNTFFSNNVGFGGQVNLRSAKITDWGDNHPTCVLA